MTKQETKAANTPAKTTERKVDVQNLEKTLADKVLRRVNEFQHTGTLRTPEDYSPENAVKAAWLVLVDAKDRNGKPVLNVCKESSIANAMLKMVILGLNPLKKQCDFIAYGSDLVLQIEYHGNIALAKRLGGVKNAVGNIIYEGDTFEYAIDPATGNKVIVKHEPDFDNIDMNKIKGAYATLTFENGDQPYIEVMNMLQIRQAWQQGATKGNSPAHKNFPDQMAIKTVINRACKLFITSSDDGALYGDDENKEDRVKEQSKAVIEEEANAEEIVFEDAVEAEPEQAGPKKDAFPDEKPKETQPKEAPEATNEQQGQRSMGF